MLPTPGHSPGHVTFATTDEQGTRTCSRATCSSRARSGGPTFRAATPGRSLASIATLLERFDDDAVVHPGHMGRTTLGRERATNPFLQGLVAG